MRSGVVDVYLEIVGRRKESWVERHCPDAARQTSATTPTRAPGNCCPRPCNEKALLYSKVALTNSATFYQKIEPPSFGLVSQWIGLFGSVS